MDIVTQEKRSEMMSAIRGKDTTPEMVIRRGLHALNYRFRLHSKDLPGKPDIVLLKWKAVIFVNGCFWHGHNCHLFKWPKTREKFWKEKIRGNMKRDAEVSRSLEEAEWRVLVIWECAIKGRMRLPVELVMRKCSEWIRSSSTELEIFGGGNDYTQSTD